MKKMHSIIAGGINRWEKDVMKAIIFDFNGTMVFDSVYHDEAWKYFSKQIRGYEMSDEEIKQCVHGKVNEKIIAYLKAESDADERKQLSLAKESVYRNIALADCEHYQLVEGLPIFLDFLNDRKIPCNIASASIKENIDFFVDVFGLERWFDTNKIVYDDGRYENKVKMFIDAAKRMNVDIHDCIIFEDSMSGIACAKQVEPASIVVVASKEKHSQYEKDPQISFAIEDFKDERVYSLIDKGAVEND
ncbi:MAG: HAD family phosphatase [Erysipelotrichia bacterium]|nr:HAD family phosphatase [Erysipelotrichia bacterium]NCC53882.1 HAD family phosphatase [Erysipelotrichia bacterium]